MLLAARRGGLEGPEVQDTRRDEGIVWRPVVTEVRPTMKL